MHALRDARGDIMDDSLGLRFHEAEPKGAACAAKVLCVEVGGGFFLAGSPNVPDNTRKLAKDGLPVDLVFHFFFTRGQIHRFWGKSFCRLFVRVINPHRFLVKPQNVKEPRQGIYQF